MSLNEDDDVECKEENSALRDAYNQLMLVWINTVNFFRLQGFNIFKPVIFISTWLLVKSKLICVCTLIKVNNL